MTATFGAKHIPIPKRMNRLPRERRGFPVPHVAEWTSEAGVILPPPIHPRFGAMVVTTGRQGEGEPTLGQMSPMRQRRAMLETRCQVCDRDLRSSKFRFMAGGPTLRWFTEPFVCG